MTDRFEILEVRKLARERRRVTWTDSFLSAFKAAAVVAAPLVAIGGIAVAAKAMSWSLGVGLASGVVCSWLAAFLALEWKRLTSCVEVLDELLAAERSFDALLLEARQERDRAELERDQVLLRLETYSQISVLVERALGAGREAETHAPEKSLPSRAREKGDG